MGVLALGLLGSPDWRCLSLHTTGRLKHSKLCELVKEFVVELPSGDGGDNNYNSEGFYSCMENRLRVHVHISHTVCIVSFFVIVFVVF